MIGMHIEPREVIERWPCCDSAKLWSGFPPMPASTVTHRRDCPTLEAYPLADWAAATSCAKCAGDKICVRYHEARWYVRDHGTDPWRGDLAVWSCLLTWRYQPVEHLDLRCERCGFTWLEATAA